MFRRLPNRNGRKQSMLRQGISLSEAAKFLQVEQNVFYLALQKGQIPTSTRDRRIVVSQGALRDYQARQQIKKT